MREREKERKKERKTGGQDRENEDDEYILFIIRFMTPFFAVN